MGRRGALLHLAILLYTKACISKSYDHVAIRALQALGSSRNAAVVEAPSASEKLGATEPDYEYMVQTSETMIDIAAIRIMLNRLAPA